MKIAAAISDIPFPWDISEAKSTIRNSIRTLIIIKGLTELAFVNFIAHERQAWSFRTLNGTAASLFIKSVTGLIFLENFY